MVRFQLDNYWNSHLLIESLREQIKPLVAQKLENSDIPLDLQDLEHQTLFFLSTFTAGAITKSVLEDSVDQQYRIIRKRLLDGATKEELEYLFRGMKKFYPDLNIHYRLKLKWDGDRLLAVGDGRSFEVEFRKITDRKQIALFTDTLHYIHQKRSRGDTFAFYFKGDRYPWAIETTERSSFSRPYKRAALIAHGFHPDKGVELTRFYSLPGSPRNAISVMDGLVRNYYQKQGIEVLFTKTMPAYSKSKSTTISGGLNKVLCTSELEHIFVKRVIDGTACWEHVSRRWLEHNGGENKPTELRRSSESFALLPAVDVYTEITSRSITPLPETEDPEKVIYFSREDARMFKNFAFAIQPRYVSAQ